MGVSDWVISKIQCSSALIVGPTAFAPPLPLPLNEHSAFHIAVITVLVTSDISGRTFTTNQCVTLNLF